MGLTMITADPITREWVEYDDLTGRELSRTPMTDAEWDALQVDPAQVAAHNAAQKSARVAESDTRQALTDALNLAALYPAPSPEENAIIDAQVATALAGFRDLSSPPADVVALAAAVVSWRATI